jgi:hypothetical protein
MVGYPVRIRQGLNIYFIVDGFIDLDGINSIIYPLRFL